MVTAARYSGVGAAQRHAQVKGHPIAGVDWQKFYIVEKPRETQFALKKGISLRPDCQFDSYL
jgi:hypothetical protein